MFPRFTWTYGKLKKKKPRPFSSNPFFCDRVIREIYLFCRLSRCYRKDLLRKIVRNNNAVANVGRLMLCFNIISARLPSSENRLNQILISLDVKQYSLAQHSGVHRNSLCFFFSFSAWTAFSLWRKTVQTQKIATNKMTKCVVNQFYPIYRYLVDWNTLSEISFGDFETVAQLVSKIATSFWWM